MNDHQKHEENLADEFRNLGTNIISALHAAWERPERIKLQQELEGGLAELAETLKSEANAFSESPTGQRMRSDIEDLGEKVRTGEAESAIRSELLKALKLMNTELQKVTSQMGSAESSPADSQPCQPGTSDDA